MKKILFITLIFWGGSFTSQVLAQTSNPNYDSQLAAKLGGDEYGMKSFILVILKTGTSKLTDNKLKSKAFAGHLKNIKRLVDENKLIVAGPFGKNNNDFRGLFILNVETIKEANALLETDPAINEGYLKAELFKWYGSAALPEYLDSSDKIWKINP